ncbi:translation elongation factor Ts [Stomatohabitans albus]|uniref:translation elongation factor Ts n=1 Tax=Stomatohabitans albus TaxID=3110766 RepID=UPI00300C953D
MSDVKISAADVKRLREATGAGMMDCKKALVEANGDFESAADIVRAKTGRKMAERAGEREAGDGVVHAVVSDSGDQGAIVKVACETDFVAKGDAFVNLAQVVAETVLAHDVADVAALMTTATPMGKTVADLVEEVQSTTKEKVEITDFRRFAVDGGTVRFYLHTPTPGIPAKIGVLVAVNTAGESAAQLASDIALHAAAARPVAVREDEVDPALVEKERTFARQQAEEEGKPANIIEKIVEGRVQALFKEQVLLNQPFVKDPSTTIAKLLGDVELVDFARFEI